MQQQPQQFGDGVRSKFSFPTQHHKRNSHRLGTTTPSSGNVVSRPLQRVGSAANVVTSPTAAAPVNSLAFSPLRLTRTVASSPPPSSTSPSLAPSASVTPLNNSNNNAATVNVMNSPSPMKRYSSVRNRTNDDDDDDDINDRDETVVSESDSDGEVNERMKKHQESINDTNATDDTSIDDSNIEIPVDLEKQDHNSIDDDDDRDDDKKSSNKKTKKLKRKRPIASKDYPSPPHVLIIFYFILGCIFALLVLMLWQMGEAKSIISTALNICLLSGLFAASAFLLIIIYRDVNNAVYEWNNSKKNALARKTKNDHLLKVNLYLFLWVFIVLMVVIISFFNLSANLLFNGEIWAQIGNLSPSAFAIFFLSAFVTVLIMIQLIYLVAELFQRFEQGIKNQEFYNLYDAQMKKHNSIKCE